MRCCPTIFRTLPQSLDRDDAEDPLEGNWKLLVEQIRSSWNSLLSWLREAEVWGQAAGGVG